MLQRPTRRSAALAAAALCSSFFGACHAVVDAEPDAARLWARGLWVTRFDWLGSAPQDPQAVEARIARIMDDAAGAHLTDVYFQVRGNGTVFYPSRLEPWSESFGFRSPGFDPLAAAVREAHARGLRLHAWINVFPGWRGDPSRADPRQLVRARADWFLSEGGAPAALEAGYYWLDPAHPSVREHVVQLCRELVRNYAVDGLHLDHVRCPNGHAKSEAVTALVRDVRTMLRRERRPPALSAAVFAAPDVARERVGQDWGRWAEDGLVDALVSMNYSDDDAVFGERTRAALRVGRGVPIVIGIGAHKLAGPSRVVQQAEAALAAGAAGVSLFSHAAVFEGRDPLEAARVLRGLE